MFLGIEIGGTKLQLGVGDARSKVIRACKRRDIEPARGAQGILAQIEQAGRELVRGADVRAIGIGFGGPVDSRRGVVTTSHQIAGWDDFPLGPWCTRQLGRPTIVGNDCDCAALAEARHGAGRGKQRVFFVTVGTGIGGGLVVDGQLQGTGRPAIAEIGHLRPGLSHRRPDATVESIASGWGIAAAVRRHVEPIAANVPRPRMPDQQMSGVSARTPRPRRRQRANEDAADLLSRCAGVLADLTTQSIADAARAGNTMARRAIDRAAQTLGWAVAQVITLLAPEVVVIGGGVSLMDQRLFLEPVRRYAALYVFPPLADSYRIERAALGEEVVVHGALLLAQTHFDP